ncbi:MAG: twin-arginine translocase TatA/TatE family subunit [Verrucomicrobiota bacterium]
MQIAIIVFVIILLFGAKKLPQLARGVGESLNEFQKARKEMEDAEAEVTAKGDDDDDKSSAA